jgi:hypothetical protein
MILAWPTIFLGNPLYLYIAYIMDIGILANILADCIRQREDIYGFALEDPQILAWEYLVSRAGWVSLVCALPWDLMLVTSAINGVTGLSIKK